MQYKGFGHICGSEIGFCTAFIFRSYLDIRIGVMDIPIGANKGNKLNHGGEFVKVLTISLMLILFL